MGGSSRHTRGCPHFREVRDEAANPPPPAPCRPARAGTAAGRRRPQGLRPHGRVPADGQRQAGAGLRDLQERHAAGVPDPLAGAAVGGAAHPAHHGGGDRAPGEGRPAAGRQGRPGRGRGPEAAGAVQARGGQGGLHRGRAQGEPGPEPAAPRPAEGAGAQEPQPRVRGERPRLQAERPGAGGAQEEGQAGQGEGLLRLLVPALPGAPALPDAGRGGAQGRPVPVRVLRPAAALRERARGQEVPGGRRAHGHRLRGRKGGRPDQPGRLGVARDAAEQHPERQDGRGRALS